MKPIILYANKGKRPSEMAEQVKVLATTPDDLYSSTTTSRIEGENQPSQAVL